MNKPPSAKVLPWLKENLGKNITAMLTTTDTEALQASVHLVAFVGYNYQRPGIAAEILTGYRGLIEHMQRKCRRLAYHAIAMVLDWNDRAKFWDACGLEPIENPGLCKYEPAMRAPETRILSTK